MQIAIKRWGNSLAIRLNRKLVHKYNLFENEKLEIVECQDGIKFKPRTELDEILATVDSQTPSYWQSSQAGGREAL